MVSNLAKFRKQYILLNEDNFFRISVIILTDFNKDRAKEMPIKDNIRIDSRFSLKYLLGSGGMGRVYLATDSENGNDVAIKFLSADNQNANKRFSREIETLSEINHKSVVQYICSGSTDDGYWYAMDHIPGPNITDWFRSKGILDYPLLSETMSHIASALSVVHEKGVVHRDVKPDNILMNGDLPVLVDFGIVHLQSSTQSTKLTHEGSIVGTAMYMSPEQVMGGIIDGRSDLYSLGTILYEILTSCHPFPAENFPRLVSKILRERPIRPTAHNPGIPKALEQITVRLLEKNPDLRYDSAEQLVESLNRFIHGGEVSKSKNQSPMKAYETKTIPFVGRTDQLEKLKTLFDSATIGNGGLAVITGESGLGKSRLLSEYKMMVLGGFGRFLECQKAGDSSVRPAISSVLNQLADYEIAYNPDFIKKHSHMIRSLSPKFANAIGIVSNPPNISDDDMIPKVIAQILCESFPEIPVVIAFEDRLDNITEKIIHECARKSIDSKVIVCCQSEADIPEFLNGIKRVSHIELQPFDVDDINQLAKSIIGRDLTTGEGEKIIKTSGGKPGIAIHLISSLKPFDETISLTSVPEYSHLLNQRVDELSNSAREIISTLSLFDKPIPLSILKPISRLTSTNFQKAFDSLESGNMIQVSNKGFELFCNIISKDVRDFVYNSLTEERFRELNQLIANTLSIYYSNSDDPDVLAMIGKHYLLAGKQDEYCKHLVKALEQLEQIDYLSSGFHYVEKLQEHIDVVDNTSIHKVLQWIIKAKSKTGDLTSFEEWVERSNQIIINRSIDDVKKSKLFLSITDGYAQFRNHHKAVVYMQKAYKNKYLFDNRTKLHLEIMQARIYMLQLDLDKMSMAIGEIERLINLIDDDAMLLDKIQFFSIKGIYLFEKGNSGESIRAFKKALQISKDINHRENMLRVMTNLGNAYHRENEFDKSLYYRNQAYEIAKDMGITQIQIKLISALLATYTKIGDVDRLRKKMIDFKAVLDTVPFSNYHIGWTSHYTQLVCLEERFEDASEVIQRYKRETIEKNQPHLLRDLLEYEAFVCFFSGKYKRSFKLFEQIDNSYLLMENESIKVKHMNILFTMVGLMDLLDLDVRTAEKLYAEAVKLENIFNTEHNHFELMLAEAHINYMKSLKSNAFGSDNFMSSPWRIAYNNLLELQKYAERDECVITMIPTYSTHLFARLVLRRMKYDRNLDSIEKRQIFDQAVSNIEWLMKRYKTADSSC